MSIAPGQQDFERPKGFVHERCRHGSGGSSTANNDNTRFRGMNRRSLLLKGSRVENIRPRLMQQAVFLSIFATCCCSTRGC